MNSSSPLVTSVTKLAVFQWPQNVLLQNKFWLLWIFSSFLMHSIGAIASDSVVSESAMQTVDSSSTHNANKTNETLEIAKDQIETGVETYTRCE